MEQLFTVYYYNEIDLMRDFQGQLSRNMSKILNEKGDESYER